MYVVCLQNNVSIEPTNIFLFGECIAQKSASGSWHLSSGSLRDYLWWLNSILHVQILVLII